MKNKIFINLRVSIFSICVFLFLSCDHKNNDFVDRANSADYYRNLFTGEIMDKSEFQKFRDSLIVMSNNFSSVDSLKERGEMIFTTHFYDFISSDSTIQEFKYSIRIGNEYIVREGSYEKIGMKIPERTFLTLDGESIQIGGKQSRPTLLNLWFVGCRGCEEEMPALNLLSEKYSDDLNFVAMTFDNEKRVSNFLKKKKFNFKHIINVDDDFLKFIGTSPYPENIFISKDGEIVNIEGGLPANVENDKKLKYFESLIEKLK